MREVRRALRELPRDRRREIVASMREGRAVRDPRDASLAAAWAEELVAKGQRVPRWLVPSTRPHGGPRVALRRHLVWIAAGLVYAYVQIWSLLPGGWRWALLGVLVYSALTTAILLGNVLRMYWNAPEAARRNRAATTEAPAR